MNQSVDLGRVIGGVFETYRDQAAVLLPAALGVFLIEGIVSGVLIAITPILAILAVVVQILANTLYQGMVVQLVADVQDGRRDSSVGDLFRSVTGSVAPLIGTGLLAGIGIVLGLVLLIVPGLFLLTIWAVVAPVVVLERPGVGAAFARSRELVRGNGWEVFGTIVVFFLILVVVSALLGAIGSSLGGAGRVIADIVGSVLAAPLVALAAAVLYFNLRAVRGEISPPPRAIGLAPSGQPPPGAPAPPPGEPAPPSAASDPGSSPGASPRPDAG